MATSKQLSANRSNGKRGGVKTEVGKAVVRWNALTHGLLAREVVIDAGDGREDRAEFNLVLAELGRQLQPVGLLEEILVEKIAASYWRYRRVLRHEVGALRRGLDRYERDYYDPTRFQSRSESKTHRRVQEELDELESEREFLKSPDDPQGDRINPQRVDEEDWPIDLEEYYKTLLSESDEIVWQDCFMTADYKYDVFAIHGWLTTNGWPPERIKREFLKINEARITAKKEELVAAKAEDAVRLSQEAQEHSLPPSHVADTLIRYEGAILRQFYRAVHELERLQAERRGMAVPPPVAIDVEGLPAPE